MYRISMTTLVGMLALTTTECKSSRTQSNNASNVQPIFRPTYLTKNPQPETFQNRVITQNSYKTERSSTNGLIQATDANQRIKQVQQGRPDPFAGLFSVPKMLVPAKPQKANSRLLQLSVVPLSQLNVEPTPLPLPLPAKSPQADLARGVTVQGVVGVSNKFRAIVKLPNEVASRYVSEGQRLSDDRVLVKKIEVSPSETLVVLEQNGIEITRTVGEEPANPQGESKTNEPIAAVLTSQSLPTASLSPLVRSRSDSRLYRQQLISQLRNSSPLISSPHSAVQTNSNARLYRQQLISRLRNCSVRTSISLTPVVQTNSDARLYRQQLISGLRNCSPQTSSSPMPAVQLSSDPRLYRQQLISRLRNR
jgi:hypothetical protein